MTEPSGGVDSQLARLEERQRQRALERFAVLRGQLEDGLLLSLCAGRAGVSSRTARRWLARYRQRGLVGLADADRADRGARRTPSELVQLIEGLALRQSAPPVAYIHRQVAAVARSRGQPAPGYTTVYAIVRAIDPGLIVLAHEGPARYRERYELCYRQEAEAPNACWQADHTQLDLLILDPKGRPARSWLTVIEDDHSRAVAGYAINLGAPSALQTALALHQAICPKQQQSGWPVCGIPEMLYSDHGSDFTSRHLEQVCADLHIRLVHSTAGVPQGRGKLERLFGTITTELLPGLPGYLPPRSGRPATPPALSMAQLDDAVGRFIINEYKRVHSETKAVPVERWTARGWLPRMPDSLQQLDLLLLTVARPRVVHRDGIHFESQRYLDLTLAAYVNEPVTIRYDPRDLAEIRVYHHDRFLCRAVSPELAGQTITLKDLQAARTARRRALRAQLTDRRKLADQFLPRAPYPEQNIVALPLPPVPAIPPPAPVPRRRLRLYQED